MQGLEKQALSTNMFCMKCHKAGMQLHRLLSRSELETYQRFLRATPILDFCANHNEVSADGLYVCCSGLNTHATLMLCNIDIGVEHLFVQAVHEIVKDAPYVTQCSGGIKAVAPEDLLPHMIGEFVR